MITRNPLYLLGPALLTISGCTMLPPGVVPHVQGAADAMRDTAEYTLCNAITVGAWRREFGNDARKAVGWELLCNPSPAVVPSPAPLLPPAAIPTPQANPAPILGDPHASDI